MQTGSHHSFEKFLQVFIWAIGWLITFVENWCNQNENLTCWFLKCKRCIKSKDPKMFVYFLYKGLGKKKLSGWVYFGGTFSPPPHLHPVLWSVLSIWHCECITKFKILIILLHYVLHYNVTMAVQSTCTPEWVLPYLDMVRRVHGDDTHFGDFQSDWVPILCLIIIWLTPSFCRKNQFNEA